MGFSIVTVFEVLHCLAKTSFASLSDWYQKVIVMKNSDSDQQQQLPNEIITNCSPKKPTVTIDSLDEVVIRMDTMGLVGLEQANDNNGKEINQV